MEILRVKEMYMLLVIALELICSSGKSVETKNEEVNSVKSRSKRQINSEIS